jgi:hypothetical protein
MIGVELLDDFHFGMIMVVVSYDKNTKELKFNFFAMEKGTNFALSWS